MLRRYREEPCTVALNRVKGMPFRWSLNAYTGCEHRCTFCYVRNYERRADRPSGDEYGRSIRVKVNIAEVLRRELQGRAWRREEVAIGTATDPYQPAEGSYRLTRACLERLVAVHNPLSIITRGPLVVRDIDVLQEASRRAAAGVSISLPTLDERAWRTTEPGTAPPRQRLRAMGMLAEAGIDVSVALAPIIPGLTDDPVGLAEVARLAREYGATRLWCRMLELRPGAREHFLECLARDWPGLAPDIEATYVRAYAPPVDVERLNGAVAVLREENGFRAREDVAARPGHAHQMELFAEASG